MESNKVRQTFLDFFKSKGHEIVPSAPMVVKGDPTLMFNNSGMAPFKDIFLGNAPIKFPRVADTQKCLRVSGKHNDLEEVGVDTYHHTMFEMLGNWSFGDYFKKEAIAWAWELLTDVYKIDKDRLYVTVFEGSKDDGLAFDQEAYDTWKQFIDEKRILNGNKKDNFWEMGDVGPCGPCSEIHYDGRSDEERKAVDGATLVNADNPQVIEIWNNVFMEFERKWKQNGGAQELAKIDGLSVDAKEKSRLREAKRVELTKLEKLSKQHVDTGMGFERLVRVLQKKTSNYDSDVFMPLINKIEELSGHRYKPEDEEHHKKQQIVNIAIRVIADHIRTISFSIADGQLPSNTGAGYVIRRILRRAIRYGYQSLNLKEPFMYRLVPTLAHQMGQAFPELNTQKVLIEKVIREEEQSFYKTLEVGLRRIDQVCIDLTTNGKGKVIDGKIVFELYDTFGFPVDLTSLIARGYDLSIDEAGFKKYLEEQKNRSRAATSLDTDDWVYTEAGKGMQGEKETEFVGYDELSCKCVVVRYRKVKAKNKEQFHLVLNKTPFYAESGGQVGDTGVLENANETILITDTKKENGVIIHYAEKLPVNMDGSFTARVDADKRLYTANNHSATHLLHAALRQVLGTHVEQKGSLVNDEYLRFDFSHFAKITEEELHEIEQIVNTKIRENITGNTQLMAIEEARKTGAMALFGEKYGDVVRVVTFDKNYSVELCGGTHVKATGQIGYFKIISESAVAAGIRRVEAVTAVRAEAYFDEQLKTLHEVRTILKGSKDVAKSLTALVEENHSLNKQLQELLREKAQEIKKELLTKVQHKGGVNVIIEKIRFDSAEEIKNLLFEVRNQLDNVFCVIGAEVKGKPSLSVIISDNLVKEKNWNAGNIVRELAKEINGGGGGQPFYAQAGGSKPEGLDTALEKATKLV
ncbi:MAG: alanine--tRNA ligase [Bacteroidetes bacterium]|nr:alanine--tRNA ligase [Bacteroidota bacterium]